MENGNKPINPIVGGVITHESYFKDDGLSGLSKREYFAGLAMQGMIQNAHIQLNLSKTEAEIIAGQSVQFADELLKQLKNK